MFVQTLLPIMRIEQEQPAPVCFGCTVHGGIEVQVPEGKPQSKLSDLLVAYRCVQIQTWLSFYSGRKIGRRPVLSDGNLSNNFEVLKC